MSTRFQILETPLQDLLVVKGTRLSDERGFFTRRYCADEFKNFGLNDTWKQINISSNKHKGTYRGMHFQVSPFAEIKLVSCTRGSLVDFAIDMRPNSPTFKRVFNIELSEQNEFSLYIPEGFAHGFQTLENNTDILYLSSNFHNSEFEKGLHYEDPNLEINLPLPISKISKKDLSWPFIQNTPQP